MSIMLSYFLFIIIFTVIALSLYFGLQAIKLI
uniref:Cytochrome b6-f complex subunit 6 n=4 Tax=Halymeniaceae TaxID=31453 RepID=A0A6F8Z1S3_9FLOR|nr:cytochrome b6-f complex subunit 6 [Grateloupia taiwanensis]YP_009488799.1 cytochrome b6-f complex subunit 6 [Grateloupia filicina]YP_010502488.1 cytochrome b6-f complex subunit 6 [Grateloupia turuturu]YP_010986412.1 cytochrome b6f complex subunit VI [Pachymeniopsis lanceolata]BCB92371.1 cytochrome b6-f complex subunit 6 [Grateloupia asiatica]AGO19828.1 cytochrome b6-f complex subunit 6 [Grateloupia taiwanensis]AWD77483.1 cytochrome b6-f complex subunit 6 [Grateloupia filicina]QHD45359.1 c